MVLLFVVVHWVSLLLWWSEIAVVVSAVSNIGPSATVVMPTTTSLRSFVLGERTARPTGIGSNNLQHQRPHLVDHGSYAPRQYDHKVNVDKGRAKSSRHPGPEVIVLSNNTMV